MTINGKTVLVTGANRGSWRNGAVKAMERENAAFVAAEPAAA